MTLSNVPFEKIQTQANSNLNSSFSKTIPIYVFLGGNLNMLISPTLCQQEPVGLPISTVWFGQISFNIKVCFKVLPISIRSSIRGTIPVSAHRGQGGVTLFFSLENWLHDSGPTFGIFSCPMVWTEGWRGGERWSGEPDILTWNQRQACQELWAWFSFSSTVTRKTTGCEDQYCSSPVVFSYIGINRMAANFCDFPGWHGKGFVCQRFVSLASHYVRQP